MNETKEDLLKQIHEITSRISTARFDIKSGRLVDLAGVQGMVKEFCQNIKDVSNPEDDKLNEAINILIEDFNVLGQELTEHRQRLGSEIIKKYSSGPKGDA